jgi:hypothetical protein
VAGQVIAVRNPSNFSAVAWIGALHSARHKGRALLARCVSGLMTELHDDHQSGDVLESTCPVFTLPCERSSQVRVALPGISTRASLL